MTNIDTAKTENSEPVLFDAPAAWVWATVEDHLCEQLRAHRRKDELELANKRVRLQLAEEPAVRDLAERWPGMDDAKRAASWQELVDAGVRATEEILPICASCGACCRTASPTLHLDDLELLRGESIKPENLMTLRKGEPVMTPMMKRPLFLTEERIKVREKPGSTECIFLDAETDRCTIYDDRPLQCRAQACWDESLAKELIHEKPLTRRHVFAGVDPLPELIEAHDRRCAFDVLSRAFTTLEDSEGEETGDVLDALAFDDHFRTTVAERLHLPADTVELIFGRSFVRLVRLFGFRVEDGPDGSRLLVPDPDAPAQGPAQE